MKRRALLALAVLAAACGKRGRPVPPETRLPAAVTDLGGFVEPGTIQLGWTNPGRRVDDSPVRDLVAARVFRVDDAGTGAAPRSALLVRGHVQGYQEVARVDLRRSRAPATDAAVEGSRVRLADRWDLMPGRRYSYVVVTEDAAGRSSPPSNLVSLVFAVAPAAPTAVEATPGEGDVGLQWQAPRRLLDGSPAPERLAFEVLRAAEPDAEPASATPEAIPETRFVDRGLENDRTYHYRVRAVRTVDGTLVRGEPSPAVAVTPRDMTPPSAPRDLVAVPAGGDVRLVWTGSPEADVATYLVHRATGERPFVRVGSVAAPATTFVDRDVPPGAHRYAITALDSGSRPNECAPSAEAAVTLP
jgi:hypothetical protein